MTQIITRPSTRDAFPLDPPLRYFEKPDWLEPGQKLTVVTQGPDAGRVAGYVCPWDQCLLDGTDDCWTPPPSPTGYAAAEQGETMTAEGLIVRTANIGGGVNHARRSANFDEAVDFMANTSSQLMRVVYGEDPPVVEGGYGIWCAGVLWPDVSDRDIAMVRASALSGDWRYRPELRAYDMAGTILVNNPGLPVIRRFGFEQRRAAGLRDGRVMWIDDPAGQLPPVYVGGLGGVGDFDPETAGICDPLEPIRATCDHCGQPLDLAEQVADLTVVVAQLAR